jgi:methionyl-tRNA synthetase
MISFEEFKKMELKVARIITVEEHPNADKLYVLKIKIQDEERQLVAGIKSYYKPEELIGKQIVAITNLEPATIRGIKSEGMLLAAQDSKTISLLIPDKEVEDGAEIR